MALVPMGMPPYEGPYSHGMPPPSRPRRRPPLVMIDFLTCGHQYHPNTGSVPVILNISCAKMLPPPNELCSRYCGLDRELSDWLFSHREYRARCSWALDMIQDGIDAWRPSRDRPRLCVIVKCKLGVHRSVAMAEKLARIVSGWRGVRVTIEYVILSRSAALSQVPIFSNSAYEVD
ncbi:MAG: hypothetical protein L6R41_003343 [Letrouitia leprolyta]|nr:MAG: hypothetical protein L6R41_003343 [Letrouitia leprolyta]